MNSATGQLRSATMSSLFQYFLNFFHVQICLYGNIGKASDCFLLFIFTFTLLMRLLNSLKQRLIHLQQQLIMVHWLVYLASGYVATSLLFFCFPTLLRRRKVYSCDLFNQALNGQKIIRISHRGGPRLTTQNTKQAFKKIIHVSDMLEMDVCETKDNVLIVHHDRNLWRTCGVHQHVNELNFKDLPKFKDEITLDFAFQKTIVSNNEKIPTLEEVFQMFPGIAMNIQLKTPTETAMKEFARLIYEYDRKDITICGIRNSNNNTFKQQNPTISVFMNDKKVFLYTLSFLFGLLPFVSIPENSLQLPVFSEEFYQWKFHENQDHPYKVKGFFNGMKLANMLLYKPIIWHFKRRGILTLLWVCNDEDSIERALKTGCQGIMTDEPFLLDNYLKNR